MQLKMLREKRTLSLTGPLAQMNKAKEVIGVFNTSFLTKFPLEIQKLYYFQRIFQSSAQKSRI